MIDNKLLIGLMFIGYFLCACNKNENAFEITCHKSIIEGDWNVDLEYTQIYEIQDSIILEKRSYQITFYEDGTGILESIIADDFTWSLQCTPDRLLINSLGGNEIEEPMNYSAFSRIYELDKITTNEIQLFAEYYRGSDNTQRLVTEELIYRRVE